MKRKALTIMSAFLLSMTMFTTVKASDIGGWSEEEGNFVIENQEGNGNAPYSTPYHVGERENGVKNGTSRSRAHGWTTWQGVYHYTTARMESWGTVLTTSGRQWGTTTTYAVSPWWYFNGDTTGSARTYYGN